MTTTDTDIAGIGIVMSDTAPAPDALTDDDRARLSLNCWEYATSSFTLLRKAQRCRNSRQLLEAGLYAWGAAEDITKAVAENWKDCGVSHEDERDLRNLVSGLLVFDSAFMQSVATVCDGEISHSEKSQAIDKLIRNQSEADYDAQLDTCFNAASDLQESFYDDDVTEFYLDRGLKSVSTYISRMLYWLRQPHPPQGFRQYQWQEPFILPTHLEQTE